MRRLKGKEVKGSLLSPKLRTLPGQSGQRRALRAGRPGSVGRLALSCRGSQAFLNQNHRQPPRARGPLADALGVCARPRSLGAPVKPGSLTRGAHGVNVIIPQAGAGGDKSARGFWQ